MMILISVYVQGCLSIFLAARQLPSFSPFPVSIRAAPLCRKGKIPASPPMILLPAKVDGPLTLIFVLTMDI